MCIRDRLPTGSHANVSMYMDAFLSAGGGAYTDVVCINMTSRMSGSYNTAFIAKNMLEEEGFPVRIHIVDSLQQMCIRDSLRSEPASFG